VTESIASSSTFPLIVLALVRVPVLRAIVKGERISPSIVNNSTRDGTVNPELKAPGSTDLYLVIWVGGPPGADL
jgi:hypothetical protein